MALDLHALLTQGAALKIGMEDMLIAEKCERSLMEFIRYHWEFVNPGEKFIEGWCIEAICEHLEAVSKGDIKRLVVNVSPGHMKPVEVNEPVLTDVGFKKLGDISVGDSVLTHRGRFCKVLAVHEQGILPVVEVKTFSGRVVKTAPDHPFLTPRGWIPAEELNDHDILGLPHVDYPERNLMTPEEARILGYLVGDGCLCQRSVCFVNMDEDVLQDFCVCAESLGFDARRKTHPNPKVKATKVSLLQVKKKGPKVDGDVNLWLDKYGLHRSTSYTKRIPPQVFQSGPEAIKNFIGAYWSCDGMIFAKHINKKTTMMSSATTVSEGLANDLLKALYLINIHARIKTNYRPLETAAQPGGIYKSFNVATTERHEVAKFADLPGLCVRKNLEAKKAFFDRFESVLYEDPVVSVEMVGFGHCRCLTVEDDHSFTVNSLAVHNSLCLNVFLPAWEWGPRRMPSTRYISASYSSSLTERDNDRLIQVVSSDRYKKLWGNVFGPSKTWGKVQVQNDKTGWKLATSVGGVSTGARGTRILIDDPNSVKEAESDLVRDSTNRWFLEVMPSRLQDQDTGSIVVIQQRTHDEDVSGTIFKRELDYEVLMIPSEYDPSRHCSTSIGWNDPRGTIDGDPYSEVLPPEEMDEQKGILCFPERFPARVIQELKDTLGPYAYNGQFQQYPVPRGGAIFKEEWWRIWPPEDMPLPRPGAPTGFPPFEYVVASIDTAYTEKEENDPSAMTVWGVWRMTGKGRIPPRLVTDDGQLLRMEDDQQVKIMLIYAWEKHLELHGPPEEKPFGVSDLEWMSKAWRPQRTKNWGIVEWVLDTCKTYRVDHLIIEAKATGIPVAQELEKQVKGLEFGVELFDPSGKGDKVARAHSVVHLFSNGRVYVPQIYSHETGRWDYPQWARMVLDRMSIFPKGKLKDITDSATQALRHLRDIGMAVRSEEAERDYEEDMSYKPTLRKLYDV